METEAELTRQGADILLREPELDERMPEAFLVHGLDPGAVVAQVGEVHAVRNGVESELVGDWFKGGSELLSAEIAAVHGVRHVTFVREFGHADHPERNPDLRGLRHG